jgi:hypothetical protein
MLMDMEKRSATLKVHEFRAENTPQESVISESSLSFPFSDAQQFRGFADIA